LQRFLTVLEIPGARASCVCKSPISRETRPSP